MLRIAARAERRAFVRLEQSLQDPAALALVSVAGPGTNLLLALLGSALFRLHVLSLYWTYSSSFPSAGQFFSTFVLINLVLMLFNLIPIAPLDGEEVLAFFLPPPGQRALASIRPYGMYILLALIILATAAFFVPVQIHQSLFYKLLHK